MVEWDDRGRALRTLETLRDDKLAQRPARRVGVDQLQSVPFGGNATRC